MRLIICDDLAALNKAGADEIAAVVGAKPTAAVVVATGKSPMGIYAELSTRSARGQFDATNLRVFQLDEYFGLADDDNRSLFAWMDRDFIQPLRVPLQNVVRLKSDRLAWRENCRAYDEAVKAAGGFDLAVLGIGTNGHLGYNEPGSHAHSPTRALLLSEQSMDASAGYGWSRKEVPLFAITCGMQPLLTARLIVLVVSGAHKREILTKALYGPIGPEVPASYLQTAGNVVVICDRAAAPEQALEAAATTQKKPQAPAVHRGVKADLVLGVDGGNSKTVAVVAQRNGKVLGYGRGGVGDMYGATPGGAMHAIDTAVQAALQMADVGGAAVGSASYSLAGCDWPEDQQLLTQLLSERGHALKLQVVNDSVGALRAGSPRGWGVAIACGSWSAIVGRARGKSAWIVCPWQPSAGGGGLAREALEAVYKANLGLAPRTVLTDRLLRFFNAEDVTGIVHQFTKREGPHPQAIQRLAPQVLDCAAEGDAAACRIVFKQAEDLAQVALSMARQVDIDRKEFPLVLTGGIFKHRSRLLPDAIAANVRAHAPKVQVLRSDLEPVAGAVMLAIELAGIRCDTRLRARLRNSMPDSSFFAT
ncbi:MAG TPA: 6-phosphogluconolactonase [Candidatus Obscuribacterales bacterium]